MRRAKVIVVAASAACVGFLASARAASAAPGEAWAYQTCNSTTGSCYTEASYDTGTGSLRAGQGCHSGAEAWTIYGSWVSKKYLISTTARCTAYDDPFFQTK